MPPFDTVAMNAVTGRGAPSYTSGVQRWKGTTASLKPMPVKYEHQAGDDRKGRCVIQSVAN